MTRKLSKNIGNIAKTLKTQIQDYNATVANLDSPPSTLPSSIHWDMIGDVASPLWETRTTLSVAVPVNIRRDAMQKYYLRQRCEVNLLRTEMVQIITHLHQRMIKLLEALPPESEPTRFQLGQGGFIHQRLCELGSVRAHYSMLFSEYVTVPALPDVLVLVVTLHSQYKPEVSPPEQNYMPMSTDLEEDMHCCSTLDEAEYWYEFAEEFLHRNDSDNDNLELTDSTSDDDG